MTSNTLHGEGGESTIHCLGLSKESQLIDLSGKSYHRAQSTQSYMESKNIARGKSVNIYRGYIYIDPEAPNSNGYQKLDSMILDKTARVHAIPELEINNHNVKCSHGSSITHLDPDKLFYTQSRGISLEESKLILVQGFLGSILQHYPEIHHHIQEKIHEWWKNN